MKLFIENSSALNLGSLEDLQALVPKNYAGVALNYGQGEGQKKILDTVWGIYVDSSYNYFMQLEEGSLTIAEFVTLLHDLESNSKAIVGPSVLFKVSGLLDGE